MDLSQLEDAGTGRSVPTTPLQVSPQGNFPFYLILLPCLLSVKPVLPV